MRMVHFQDKGRQRRARPRPRIALPALFVVFAGLLCGPFLTVGKADDAPLDQNPGLQNIELIRLGLASLQRFEFTEMVTAIARGSQMGPGEGWFHDGQSRYGPLWLAARYDANHDNTVTRAEFAGSDELYKRLDRDRDGILTIDDFDWSEQSPFLRAASQSTRPFFFIDSNSNGRVSRAEWDAFFVRISQGKEYVTPEDFRMAFLPPRERPQPGQSKDEPTPLVLISGLLKGELGSMFEGPRIDQPAPPFSLQTQDGKQRIALSDYRDKKPLVLIFGSFT